MYILQTYIHKSKHAYIYVNINYELYKQSQAIVHTWKTALEHWFQQKDERLPKTWKL